MIYAVNKRTKEHQVVKNPGKAKPGAFLDCKYSDDKWLMVDATPDGWIEWHGRECPLPDEALCETMSRSGQVDGPMIASDDNWHDDGKSWCISAYRPILDADTKPRGISKTPIMDSYRESQEPEPPAWDGGGLPPAGCECEFNIENGAPEEWRRAVVVGHYAGRAVFCMPDDKVAISKDGFPRFFSNDNPADFRPIRSEEDRAIDEMVRIITDGHSVYTGAHESAERIYRAGYRKVDS